MCHLTSLAMGFWREDTRVENQGEDDLVHLETRIKDLHTQLTQMSATDDVDELLALIHRPGWTTPAEWRMALGLVDAMHDHLQTLATLRQALMNGSRAVGVVAQEASGAPS